MKAKQYFIKQFCVAIMKYWASS